MDGTELFKITKINNSNKKIIEDLVVQEIPLTLNVNSSELVTLLCSPIDLENLGIGFLFTSGLIQNIDQMKKIVIDTEKWILHIDLTNTDIMNNLVFKRMYTSGCGKGILFYNALDIMYKTKISSEFVVETKLINSLMKEFLKKSKLYLSTGGVHSAAIVSNKQILVFKDDIGRHNAIDKVVGEMLSQKIPFENTILLTSGRISSEIVFKIQKCKIPIIVSKTVPTNQAVKLANNMNITLVGFARGERMNVYSGEERIVL